MLSSAIVNVKAFVASNKVRRNEKRKRKKTSIETQRTRGFFEGNQCTGSGLEEVACLGLVEAKQM